MTVSAGQQRDSATYIHVSNLLQTSLPSKLSHNIEQSSMCNTIGPCWLSVLNIAVCACKHLYFLISFILTSSLIEIWILLLISSSSLPLTDKEHQPSTVSGTFWALWKALEEMNERHWGWEGRGSTCSRSHSQWDTETWPGPKSSVSSLGIKSKGFSRVWYFPSVGSNLWTGCTPDVSFFLFLILFPPYNFLWYISESVI